MLQVPLIFSFPPLFRYDIKSKLSEIEKTKKETEQLKSEIGKYVKSSLTLRSIFNKVYQ